MFRTAKEMKNRNMLQIECIKEFIKMNHVDPDVDSVERRKLEMAFVLQGYSKVFSDKWEKYENVYKKSAKKEI